MKRKGNIITWQTLFAELDDQGFNHSVFCMHEEAAPLFVCKLTYLFDCLLCVSSQTCLLAVICFVRLFV